MSKDEACTETAVAFAEAEIAWRRYHRKLCNLAGSALQAQRVCGEDDKPVHACKFASMHADISEAINESASSNGFLSRAHECGDKICEDGGIIVTGGGGKSPRQMRDFYMADLPALGKCFIA